MFANSDIAFFGNRAYAGNYEGFRILNISDPSNPTQILDFICFGPQNDISIWDANSDGTPDLLFLSVDSPLIDDQCGQNSTASPRTTAANNPDSWEGVRIFAISGLYDATASEANPVVLANVPTDCGSHTHTLIPGKPGDNNIYLYVSSYPLGPAAVTTNIAADSTMTPPRAAGTKNDGTDCLEPEAGQQKQDGIHNKISIIKVSLATPASAANRIAAGTPGCAQTTGWCYPNVKEVGLPGNGYMTQFPSAGRSFDFTGCHDIAAFVAKDRAVGSCWREALIWDISDPFSPLFLRRIRSFDVDTLFHSVTFTWDGKLIALEDEAGGGGEARCKLEDGDPDNSGAMYFYTLSGKYRGTFKIPRHITGPCTAHNYTTLPLTNGRYVMSSAWYYGGTSMIDFTDPANAKEVGYYVANSPVVEGQGNAHADTWSSYWYNGRIYANDGIFRGVSNPNPSRGLDVFRFDSPLTSTAQNLPFLNAQTQMDLIPQTYTKRSSISLRYRHGAFRGKVGSEDERCVAGRRVTVKKVRRGTDRVVGRTTTSTTGKYSLSRARRRLSGRYYAQVQRKDIQEGINTVRCAATKSRTIRL